MMNTDHLHKLLQKQVAKYLGEDCLQDDRYERFLDAVNNSYIAYEKDQALSTHAFRISEQEYAEVNDRLKEEIAIKKVGIGRLKEAIQSMSDSGADDSCNEEEDNLMSTLAYLNRQILKRKAIETELQEARLEAEESSRSKESFLANMSHEIRTPMNGILGMSRQLLKTELSRKQQIYLDTINSAAENLLVVINDILDISKIEAGKLMLEHIGFRMQDVFQRSVRVMQHRAEEKGLRMSFAMDESIFPILLGDPYRLNQVLLNLLSNAVKFTDKGSVMLRCTLTPPENEETGMALDDRGDSQVICIKVIDTGIGMDAIFIDQLFQKFSQEDESVARKFGGTGLGMSISKQLVELMGGTISVDSTKGKGTDITIRVKLRKGGDGDIAPKDDTVLDPFILGDKRILLVEDNEINRFVATTVLNNYGATVSQAFDGEKALAMLRTGSYDLVLMDVQMPVMGGLEAARIIRKEIDTDIPIIALTANAIKGESEQCLAAGMNGYISKPFEEEDLVKMIVTFLDPGAAIKRVAVAPEDTFVGASLYSLDKLRAIAQGDKHFVLKIVQLFLETVPLAVQQIKTALAGDDFASVRSIAHRIKPILSDMRIQGQPAGVSEIESMALEAVWSPALEELVGDLEATIKRVALALATAP